MNNKVNKYIYWIPRILSVIFILFLALMSLDIFDSNYGFWGTVLGLFMHNIPTIILLCVLIASWKHEIIGGIGFIVAGFLYIAMILKTVISEGFEWYYVPWTIQISGIAFLIGILFIITWYKKKKITIGVQGDRGSTNEKAANFFAMKHDLKDFKIKYLITTTNVLKSLKEGKIDYGTFAWESSRAGLVKETQEAIKTFKYKKIDEEEFQLDHALLKKSTVDKTKLVRIFSHPQALKEHKAFLEAEFPKLELLEELDTAVAAEKLKNHEYPENSLIIAPISCAEIYDLDIYLENLPTNEGYLTKIYFVEKLN